MATMSNVSSVRGNVSSAMGEGAFVETEKTEEEHYIAWSMVVLLLLTLDPLKRHLSIILSQVIFDYVLPAQAAI
jgi:hypothetical protein